MEFRIAPLILVILNALYLLYCIINMQDVRIKQVGIGFGVVALAYGASLSHSYYTKRFMQFFYGIALFDILLAGYLLYKCFS